MKIVVSYTKTYDEIIEVDDKFKMMIDKPNAELHQELDEIIANTLPDDSYWFVAYDDETGVPLIEY